MISRRSQSRHNRLIVTGIAMACCFALYALFLKVQRLMELSEMDRVAKTESFVTSFVYLNHSYSNDSPSLKFLIHSQSDFPIDFHCETTNSKRRLKSKLKTEVIGPSRVLLGTCNSLEDPFSVVVGNDEFSTTIDPLLAVPHRRSVVCLSLAVLYEDVEAFKALLDHYEEYADKVEVYVSSWHEKALKETERREKVSIVWWPFLQGSRRPHRKDRIPLDADSYEQTLAASFGDCWLRNAPFSDSVTFVDIGGMRFSSTEGKSTLEEMVSLEDLKEDGWRLKSLTKATARRTSDMSLKVTEACGGECETATKEDKGGQNSSFVLKTTSSTSIGESSYRDDVERCTSFKGHFRRMMQPKTGVTEVYDPCQIKRKREGFHCRVASHTVKRMFSQGAKVNVVLKRQMLKFNDGYQ